MQTILLVEDDYELNDYGQAIPLADSNSVIADDIEATIANSLEKEITTVYIGELVMERLKELDDVAYVRFASVHRQFKDIQSLYEEVSKIIKK